MMDDTGKVLTCLITVFLLITLLPIYMVINGVVLQIMWGWFIVPLGIRTITTLEAIGIALVIGLLTAKPRNEITKKETSTEAVFSLLGWLLSPVFVLLIGYVVHAFM
jgi:uncharacterized membrane protein YgaE (UPF0421/DUF939 family)